ncbi:DNA replication regulator SLD2 [Abortiporus biennis]
MDVAALKSEIKKWEHEFRKKHGRNPSVQEIKDNPPIAEKYKLYKKLSKVHASSNPSSSKSSRPSTPPKSSKPSTTSLFSKPRAVITEAPQQSSNPFSPVKNKNKHIHSPSSRISHSLFHLNPFATPSKSKSTSRVLPKSPSPDPFPLIQSSQPTLSSNLQPDVQSNHAVIRARKRLRGEPVSPSPVKQKRARVGGTHSTFALAKGSTIPPGSDVSDEGDSHPHVDPVDASFFDDTPAKPPTGGKQFLPLFDQSPVHHGTKRPLGRIQSRVKSSASKLFPNTGAKPNIPIVESDDEEAFWNDSGKIKALNLTPATKARNKLQKKIPSAVLPGKDDLWSNAGPSKNPSTNKSKSATTSNQSRTSHKRSSSDHEMEVEDDSKKEITLLEIPLLPPSPPPANENASKTKYGDRYKAKGKGKATLSRTKAKILEEMKEGDGDEADSPEDENTEIKVVNRWKSRKLGQTLPDREDDDEWDSVLSHPTRHTNNAFLADSTVDSGNLEVDLPDDLKRMLAITSEETKGRDDTEDKMVKELLYGSRVLHYQPNKGGEIWDVGELDGLDAAQERAGLATEDEWEGEPVPWEVGEL